VRPVPLVHLEEVASLKAGVGFPLHLQGRRTGDYPLAKVGDISRVGRSGDVILRSADHFVTRQDLALLKTEPIPAGSVLFAKIGEAIRQNHRVIAGCDLLVDNNAMAAIPTERMESRYLYHYLRTVDFYRLASATTVPALRKSELAKLRVPLPSLKDQRRITEILDKADTLRFQRRTTIRQLDNLARSIFLDMFGDPAKNPKQWARASLEDLITVGPQNGLYKPSSDYGSGIPIVRIDAFYDGMITKLASLKRVRMSMQEQALYSLREGEILINRVNSREYLGKSALVPALSEPTVFESNMMRLGVDHERIQPGYLIQYLQSGFVRAHILRSAKDAVNQSSINQQDVKALPVIVPPLENQKVFVRRITATERLKARFRASLSELDALFASLQHRAFNGEL
jgi:type I restriction enzyme, S subunit